MRLPTISQLAQPLQRTETLLRLVPISVVLVVGVLLSISTHRLLDEHQSLLVHTHQVIETTKDVLIGLDDAETGQRGYLLTGDPRDLRPYTKALERLATLPATLRTQVSDNSTQAARLDTVAG